jgi:hypothetical protein
MATAKGTGLLEACERPDLLNFPMWKTQRELLRQVDKGPRGHVWALGRRSGKTTMAALVGLWDCLLRPELDGLVRPGERRYSVCVATNLRQARLYVSAARSIVEAAPLLAHHLVSATDDELAFANHTVLAAFPCTSRGARGWPISSLLLDEAAHHVDTEGNQAGPTVWQALYPSTAQFGDRARIIVSSTPYGQDGFFADRFELAASGELRDFVAHQYPTADVNPTISAAFLEDEEKSDPEGYRSEYLAEFVAGGDAFLDPDDIDAAVEDRPELQPEHATGWVAGLDPAYSADPFGLAIVGWDRVDRKRLRLGYVTAWKPPKRRRGEQPLVGAAPATLDAVAAACKRFGVSRTLTDQYSADLTIEALRERGVFVKKLTMGADSKTAAYMELRARLQMRTLELYPDKQLLTELRRLRTKFSAGSSRVENPRIGGSHGDRAQALAMAIQAAGRNPSKSTWKPREGYMPENREKLDPGYDW